jgi:vacuolar-type H+-ATPase subunit E/Vma4
VGSPPIISRICNDCWKAAETLRSNTDAGYRAWLERKRAKETEAKAKRSRTAKQQAHTEKLNATRTAKLAKELPVAELSDG